MSWSRERVSGEGHNVCVANGLRKVVDFPSSANVVTRETQAAQR